MKSKVLPLIAILLAVCIWTVATSETTATAGYGCHGPTLADGCAGEAPVVAVRCAGPLRSVLMNGKIRRMERRAMRRARRAHRIASRGCHGYAAPATCSAPALPATCAGQ